MAERAAHLVDHVLPDAAVLGALAGARVARYGSPPEERPLMTRGPCHAGVGGFDLHAGIVVRAGDRERLERLCRYTLRPPVADARLRVDAEGHVWIALRHPWADIGWQLLRLVHPQIGS